jgi:NAD(P)-dependent dehydrogenase (short-subunit alcohol dehydrogenase family)
MRAAKQGLLVWVSSSSSAGGTPPYLAPYFAAKAAMDALAVQYARELSRWGIETTIVVPGAFTKGTNHFAHLSGLNSGDHTLQLLLGAPKPVSAPDPVDDPSVVFQDGLAQPISITGGSRLMICGAVTFDADKIAVSVLRVSDR